MCVCGCRGRGGTGLGLGRTTLLLWLGVREAVTVRHTRNVGESKPGSQQRETQPNDPRTLTDPFRRNGTHHTNYDDKRATRPASQGGLDKKIDRFGGVSTAHSEACKS